jgi:catechol 2,3-dioxygenase-like lactoylglutathione lyase family enzyme
MISHISLGVVDLARAVVFYDTVLAPLGYARLWKTQRGAGYGVSGHNEPFAIFEVGDEASPPGRGWHLALTAPTRGAVEGFHRAALSCGAVDEGPPGLRPQYGADYYAAFVRDLDGYKLEAVCYELVSSEEEPSLSRASGPG